MILYKNNNVYFLIKMNELFDKCFKHFGPGAPTAGDTTTEGSFQMAGKSNAGSVDAMIRQTLNG
jgi:hypothetical protein